MQTINGVSREVRPVTRVTYMRANVRSQATFTGHLTESEVQRRMLFERQTPKYQIRSWEHGQ